MVSSQTVRSLSLRARSFMHVSIIKTLVLHRDLRTSLFFSVAISSSSVDLSRRRTYAFVQKIHLSVIHRICVCRASSLLMRSLLAGGSWLRIHCLVSSSSPNCSVPTALLLPGLAGASLRYCIAVCRPEWLVDLIRSHTKPPIPKSHEIYVNPDVIGMLLSRSTRERLFAFACPDTLNVRLYLRS